MVDEQLLRMQELDELTRVLQKKVPYGRLSIQHLPLANTIRLALIEESYPQAELNPEQISFLMDGPPYWAFCWASGQVLAKYLLDHPEEVKDKTVIDFGCGSGVVAIAAKLAGAHEVFAVDNDPAALLATTTNATLNQVQIEVCSEMKYLPSDTQSSTLLISDVFYDAENIPMLRHFLKEFSEVVVADSRVKPTELPGVQLVKNYQSCTVPDLGESLDFNNVNIYR